MPLEEHGFVLHMGTFVDALALRYGWTPQKVSTTCACGTISFTFEHALSCSRGWFPIVRHNESRDITATLLTEIYNDVCVEPDLQEVTTEELSGRTAITTAPNWLRCAISFSLFRFAIHCVRGQFLARPCLQGFACWPGYLGGTYQLTPFTTTLHSFIFKSSFFHLFTSSFHCVVKWFGYLSLLRSQKNYQRSYMWVHACNLIKNSAVIRLVQLMLLGLLCKSVFLFCASTTGGV